MTDDRYRREYYGDPQKVLVNQSSYAGGCRGCLHDVYDKLKGWKCTENIPGFPHKTRDDCKHWIRKKK